MPRIPSSLLLVAHVPLFPPLWPSLPGCKIRSKVTTYTRELGAAVTALGDSSALLDVQNSDVTTGSLDDSGPVGAGVVAMKISPVSYIARQDSALAIIREAIRNQLMDIKAETHPLRRR